MKLYLLFLPAILVTVISQQTQCSDLYCDPNDQLIRALQFRCPQGEKLLIIAESHRKENQKQYYEYLFNEAMILFDDAVLPRARSALESGADPDTCDERGKPALSIAANLFLKKTVELLLHFHANPNNPKMPELVYPLHFACWSPIIIEILLQHDANPNLKTTNGQTPLHWISALYEADHDYSFGCAAAEKLLNHNTTNPTVADSEGRTALTLAHKHAEPYDEETTPSTLAQLIALLEEHTPPPLIITPS